MRSKLHIEILKERIALSYDVEYVVDVLGISVEQLLDAFEEKLDNNRHLFEELEEEEYDTDE